MNNRHNDPFDDYDDEDEGFMTFDARGEDNSPSRGPIILAAIVLLFLVFGAILWVYFTGNKSNPDEAPVISAQTDTFKEAPINQTGYVTEDMDKGVYAAGSGQEPPPLQIQAIDGSEQPVLKPSQTATPAAKPSVNPAPVASSTVPKPAVTTPKPAATAPKAVVAAPKATTATPSTTPVQPAVKPNTAEVKTPAKSGGVTAQLGSFPTKAAAEKALADYRASGMSGPATIAAADLGAKGTWYRVKATGFKTREQALEFCAKAKAAGANCIPAN